jgi:gamma-glutamyltranspeptidase/glutathione hydrolase
MAMPFGTPGGDVQTRRCCRSLLNINLFDMEPQEAIEAPRVASYSFPSSFEPHAYIPGASRRPHREGNRRCVGNLGHKVEWWPGMDPAAGVVAPSSPTGRRVS